METKNSSVVKEWCTQINLHTERQRSEGQSLSVVTFYSVNSHDVKPEIQS